MGVWYAALMPTEYWNQHNEVFVKTYQKLNDLPADGLAGEQTFTALDGRCWPLRNLPDGRECFITNPFKAGVHDGVDVFWRWQDGDQLIDGYWTKFGDGRVWYPYGTRAIVACDGVVRRSEAITTGWLVTVEHANGDVTGYFHGVKQTALVKPGDGVGMGMPVFYCGWDLRQPLSEDNVVHVHFSVQRDGVFIDPAAWLKYAAHNII